MTDPTPAAHPLASAVAAPVGQPESILVSFGDIHFSQHWVVTPIGNRRLKGAQLQIADLTVQTQVTPGWTIVLAILFFPLGLLFLMVKEPRAAGSFHITVLSDNFSYQVLIPVTTSYAAQFTELHNRVAYARNLIANDV